VRASGFPQIEERTRFTVTPPTLDMEDANIEAQAAGDHWEIVAWWRSRTPYRGSASTTLPGVADAEEAGASTRHVVRLHGPVPAGTVTVRLAGRAEGESVRRDVGELSVEVPRVWLAGSEDSHPDAPPGTPMPRAVAWNDGDENDLFMESPPSGETYGVVRWLEFQRPGDALVDRGSSAGLFTGIPVDAADADGDGLGELVVFRLDGWSVWEAEDADGFPTRRVHQQSADTSVPVRFVLTDGGVRLLVASGSSVFLYRAGESGYDLAGQADGSGRALKLPGEVADIDGDGVPEAIFADETGDVVVFRVGASGVERVVVQALAHPMSGKFMAISGTAPAQLLAASLEPSGADAEAELARAAVRVTRLAWTEEGFEERRSVSIAGFSAERDLQFLDLGAEVALLRRGARFDDLIVWNGGLDWGGALESSRVTRVDRAVRYGYPNFYHVLWSGSAGVDPGEQRVWNTLPLGLAERGLRSPRVESASEIPDGLRLVLAWDEEGCGPGTVVWVGSSGAPQRRVAVNGLRAVDTLSVGASATYHVLAGNCTWPTLTVTALTPSPQPALEWDDAGRILASFARPLGAPPQDVRLRGEAGDILPSAIQLDRTGARLVVSFPPGALPHSLFITGAVDTAGLPAGGAWHLALPLPPAPADATPVLADVEYFAGPLPRLIVHGRPAVSDSCDAPFVLEPGGLLPRIFARILYPAGVILALDEPLRAGAYTLSVRPDCLPAGANPLGISRSFRVGVAMFPNPLRLGEPLVLENVLPGSEVEVLDVAGRVRTSWRVSNERERRDLGDLPPGLYFIRLQEVADGSRTTRKLVVLR
jgi:hypothetical protein